MALTRQTEIQVLASLLDTEIHLQNFNNKQEINAGKQKGFAKKNFTEIELLKKKIGKLLNENP